MRLLLVLLLAAAGLLATRAEPLAPDATLATPVDVVGHATAVRIIARDRGTGLAEVDVRLIPGGGGAATTLAHQEYPLVSWFGSGVHEVVVDTTLDAGAAHLPEGPATLEVWARDHSWLAGLHRGPRLVQPVTVKLTPPTLDVLTSQHVARLGGSEFAVFRPGADAVASGVQVGPLAFPSVAGLFADGTLRATLFAVPQDAPAVVPTAFATDVAGNRRTQALDLVIKSRTFAEKTLDLSDGFLARKVPELLHANGLDESGDLIAGYLRINRELRASTEVRLRELCRESAPTPLWEGEFLRLPNSAPLSGFADRRSYVHAGQVVDHQTHLGFDLASLKGSPVPAGNTGRVVFAGPLGIYGTTVVLDHGLGLFSLYGHLSAVAVAPGASVRRGDTIGNTGDTGLAGGDHLHFSVMIHGIHVDPVEWWDAHWIHDHVEARLNAFPRAAAAGPAP